MYLTYFMHIKCKITIV